VHGVYRLEGATALSYSLTEPTQGIGSGGTNAFPSDLQDPRLYDDDMASAVELLDVVGLQGYRRRSQPINAPRGWMMRGCGGRDGCWVVVVGAGAGCGVGGVG
jgi:hypothetical protein